MIDAAETIWVCEKGHVDDHHLDDPNPDNLCSRCGGTCEQFTLDGLAREYIERLRVNVGILAQNTQLKRKLEIDPVRKLKRHCEVSAVGWELKGRGDQSDPIVAAASAKAETLRFVAEKIGEALEVPSTTERSGR